MEISICKAVSLSLYQEEKDQNLSVEKTKTDLHGNQALDTFYPAFSGNLPLTGLPNPTHPPPLTFAIR